MHEVGIAQSILDIAIDNANKNGAKKINLISVNIGKMSAVDFPALDFAFNALKEGTIASESKLECNEIELKCECFSCGAVSALEGYFSICPKCESREVRIISGDELNIAYIDVE